MVKLGIEGHTELESLRKIFNRLNDFGKRISDPCIGCGGFVLGYNDRSLLNNANQKIGLSDFYTTGGSIDHFLDKRKGMLALVKSGDLVPKLKIKNSNWTTPLRNSPVDDLVPKSPSVILAESGSGFTLVIEDPESCLHSSLINEFIQSPSCENLRKTKFNSVKDAIRYIKRRIKSILKKWVILWRRDLRKIYTTILRYHFKSLDDCSHHRILLFTNPQATIFFNYVNNYLHEKAGNYRSARDFT
jgi:hypothetical protein